MDKSKQGGLSKVCKEYQERFCTVMSRGAFDEVKSLFEKGLEPELMILAIEKAVQKSAKWSYAKAILERCIEEGIFTKEVFEDRIRFNKIMQEFKARFHKSEEELLPFVILEAYRDEAERIKRELAKIDEEYNTAKTDV